MQPLMITATPNICWLDPSIPYPKTAEEFGAEAKLCEEAGAQIMHMHSDNWPEWVTALREATNDVIVQCGMSSVVVDKRQDIFDMKSDLISIITSHHDEAFADEDFHVLHPREELVRYAELSNGGPTRLEYEIWHTGGIWNLKWLIENNHVEAPYFTSLFFGWPGGSWTPPTVEEYFYRRRHLPEGSVATVSIMAPEQRAILAAAIANGDHVRVGTEDYPYDKNGKVAAAHELVAEVAELARSLGRPLATAAEAREMSGLDTGQ